MKNTLKKKLAGFSLVEMAIVLVIVGLLLGGMLTPLSVQMEQRKISETQRQMEEIKEALTGFALRNGYLPCPAISAANGLEDRNGDTCSDDKRQGYIPWATLGVGKLDSWGHLFRYSVTPAFTTIQAPFTMSTRRDISIYTRSGSDGALTGATAENDIPAVVMSHGKNGYRGTSDQGIPVADPSTTNLDEKANAGGDGTRFIARPPSDNARQPGGEFDDLVSWISPNILYNRMVAAQRLP
ncbi:MAG TPA: prepilin-type N-terminal cleavage/methylation domain-containing protein [Janthinobacterium sp.]|nr:prepilin-type N-terminal cleavage/methylation domain-containing protein [Janthinobacterium sp.]